MGRCIRKNDPYCTLIALTAVTTMVVSVPVPAVKGYINIGDSVVILSGLIFGPGQELLQAPSVQASLIFC